MDYYIGQFLMFMGVGFTCLLSTFKNACNSLQTIKCVYNSEKAHCSARWTIMKVWQYFISIDKTDHVVLISRLIHLRKLMIFWIEKNTDSTDSLKETYDFLNWKNTDCFKKSWNVGFTNLKWFTVIIFIRTKTHL